MSIELTTAPPEELAAIRAAMGVATSMVRGTVLSKLGQILTCGSAGTFDAALVESPAVEFDPVTQLYCMSFVGYTQTSGNNGGISAAVEASAGLATSPDGITWTKVGQILAKSGSGADSHGVSGPVIIRDPDDGTWYMFYIGLTASGYEGGTKTMCYATASAPDGTWTRHGAIISPSGSGWRKDAIWHASQPVKVAGTWYLFFNATGDVAAVTAERIGYATASSLAGPWTVDDVNSPVLSPGGMGAWDVTNVGDPSVYQQADGSWIMGYYGSSPSGASDGIAFTSSADFPLNWTKFSGNPVLAAGASGTFDDTYAHKPFILSEPARLLHYYTADDGTARSIGLARDVFTIPNPFEPDGDILMAGGDVEFTGTNGLLLNDIRFYRVGGGSGYVQALVQPSSGNNTLVYLFAPSGSGSAAVMEFYYNSDLGSGHRAIFKIESSALRIGGDGSNVPIIFIWGNADKVKVTDELEVLTAAKGLILASPNGTRYRITVSDIGVVTSTAV